MAIDTHGYVPCLHINVCVARMVLTRVRHWDVRVDILRIRERSQMTSTKRGRGGGRQKLTEVDKGEVGGLRKVDVNLCYDLRMNEN